MNITHDGSSIGMPPRREIASGIVKAGDRLDSLEVIRVSPTHFATPRKYGVMLRPRAHPLLSPIGYY